MRIFSFYIFSYLHKFANTCTFEEKYEPVNFLFLPLREN